jgi:hypothetical protein
MKVGYTEFSFGYAFTENLIRSSAIAPVGAPVFPNLIQEGSAGYDIRINLPGVPLFFQYKLPELMKKGTAFEIAKYNCPGLSIPFFRMAMMRRDVSRQHELLIELEARYHRTSSTRRPASRASTTSTIVTMQLLPSDLSFFLRPRSVRYPTISRTVSLTGPVWLWGISAPKRNQSRPVRSKISR